MPTAERARVEELQTGFTSEYRAAQVRYGVTLPAELLDPEELPAAADQRGVEVSGEARAS